VLVCPGTYQEQVVITQAVTLEGISTGDSDQAVIVPPSGGLTNTAADDLGNTLFYQVWVNNASGPVNVSKLTIDGTGNGVTSACFPFVVGVFLQNSAGTVNSVATRNQKGNGCGFGFYVEGGATNPSVTIQNSSIHDYDFAGIQTETNSGTSELTATITGNDVTCAFTGIDFCGGILLEAGTTDTVTGNFISSTATGIAANPSVTGSISRNTVVNTVNSGEGIDTAADAVSVTSNKIINTNNNNTSVGILLFTSVATIQGNVITNANAGIDFNCKLNPNVHSNTILDAGTGVVNVPSATITTNSYANVGTIRTGC
jgi:hypothetical protein